jgi:hypothetical protein
MNLHGLVGPIVGAVNPPQTATIQVSTGYTTNPDGTRVPSYQPVKQVQVQVQALTANDLTQIDGLNIQGIKRKLYLNGRWDGVVRTDGKGGDVIALSNGEIYLVVLVLEYWPDWTSLCCVLQDGS